MGRRCCVANCPSTSRLLEHHGVTYHSFPLDAVIRAIWIKNSRISLDRQITKSVLVCSRHFRRLDFHTIRNGKYLLKPRVFPTVFPWGKMEASEIEADHRALQQATVDGAAAAGASSNSNSEDVIKATVDAIVAQILAETAERNAAAAAAAAKSEEEATAKEQEQLTPEVNASSVESEEAAAELPTVDSLADSPLPSAATPPKYGPLTNVAIGARLEAQNSENSSWLPARIVEINEPEQTLLIRFDRNNKLKASPSTPNGSNQEWLSAKSERLRQRINARVLPVFELAEKCMARWSGPRKFPGSIKKLLGNDTYEVLFDDGYTKNVRAVHMNKLPRQLMATDSIAGDLEQVVASVGGSTAVKRSGGSAAGSLGGSSNKKSKITPQRKDWPLLDMSNLDLAALGLPEIPHDGEWTCHWVNDQPIGAEGFLIVGEHHKPTVIVQDWRLPTGWIKHMYQRSNVLGKWDVILVSPSGKRFRSKSDLKIFLESQGSVYNPDVYDFSIHRRRAKDINAYVYTHDYRPQQPPKPKQLDVTLNTSSATLLDSSSSSSVAKLPATMAASTPLRSAADESQSQYMETPVASLMPPAELMSPQAQPPEEATPLSDSALAAESDIAGLAVGVDENGAALVENGYAFIGGLKVQITDNLFVCPREGCGKTYRKEDFLQIHIRHYHKEFAQHVSHCPKMQELAVKRTHPSSVEPAETLPKNQIPNQQFFAKLHQQDIQHSRSFRRQAATSSPTATPTALPSTPPAGSSTSKALLSPKLEPLSPTQPLPAVAAAAVKLEPGKLSTPVALTSHSRAAKRARFSPSKRLSGSRKSSRQRTQRRHANLKQNARAKAAASSLPVAAGEDNGEESRQSLNTSTATPTPDVATSSSNSLKKRRAPAAAVTPISAVHSPATLDSVSTPSSNDQADINAALPPPPAALAAQTPQYIKENGELIRIVRMRQEEIISCICEYGEEDGLMIQCELCLCWQHGACNGIVKESDVPDKYVCYICRNPQRVRDSMRFKHDQDWLFEGRLPVANYHMANPLLTKQSELLKRSHTLTGNLLDAKRSMHSLLVKINIAKNRCHPKLYLWAKKWDEDHQSDLSPLKRPKLEQPHGLPHVPQPEAAIDTEECQYRLIEHVKVQQTLLLNRLNGIEAEMDQLEKEDDLCDLKDADMSTTKEALATYIKDLETLKRLAKLNNVNNMKQTLKEQEVAANAPLH